MCRLSKMKAMRASVLHGFKDICHKYNLDYRALLRSANLPVDIDPFSDNYLPIANLYQLLFNIKQESQCEHLALEVASLQGVAAFGILGQLMATANTFNDAWLISRRYEPIFSGNFIWDMVPSTTYIKMDFKPLIKIEHSEREAIELAVAQFCLIFRFLSGQKWRPYSVCFRHSPPQQLKPYKGFFRVPIIFNSEFDGVWLRQSDLEIVLPGAEPQLHTTLKQYADTLLAQREEDHTLQLARAHIKHHFATGENQLSIIANKLEMSPRKLQRRLQVLGYRYEQLSAEVRMELSYLYLKNNQLSITQIAEMVGYKNTCTFSTAFKKHTQQTPRQWRQQHSIAS